MESNVEIARRGFEAALAGDLDVVREFLDPEVRWHGGDPDGPGACRDREQVLGLIGRASGGPRVVELVEVIGAGEKVVVILRPLTGGDGDGEPFANLTTFRDGKAIEMVHYPDPADALRALDR